MTLSTLMTPRKIDLPPTINSERDRAMNFKIRLERTIKTACFRVKGMVYYAQKRQELMAVLLRAQECGGTVTPREIANHLLGVVSLGKETQLSESGYETAAQRLIHICVQLQLLETGRTNHWEANLTELGLNAIEDGEVLVPHHGTWTVWLTQDPFIPDRVLRIEPWTKEPSAIQESKNGKNGDHEREREFEDVSEYVGDCIGKIIVPRCGEGQRLRVDQIDPKGERVDPEASLKVVWERSDITPHVNLQGQLCGKRVDSPLDAPNLGLDEVWESLLMGEALWSMWDEQNQSLRAHFSECVDSERSSLQRELKFQEPVIDGLGKFIDTSVGDVALQPASQLDAEEWAMWLLRHSVQDYVTADRFESLQAQVREKFPNFDLSLDDRNGLAQFFIGETDQDGRLPASYWHIQAPLDWEL